MSKKRFSRLTTALLTAAMIVSMFMVPAIPAKCASKGITTISPDKVYTNLDVTGNGKKDRFKVQRPKVTGRPVYRYLTISVNGKEAYKINVFYEYLTTKLITLSNGRKYLFVACTYSDACTSAFSALLEYKGGKFVKVIDFDKIFKPHAQYWNVSVSSVPDNSIKFKIDTTSYGQGYLNGQYLMQYVYQGGSMVHLSSSDRLITYGAGTRTALANKTCNAYSNTNRTTKVFSLPKGAKVSVDQCRISSTRVLCRVRYGTRYGWVVASEACLDTYLH